MSKMGLLARSGKAPGINFHYPKGTKALMPKACRKELDGLGFIDVPIYIFSHSNHHPGHLGATRWMIYSEDGGFIFKHWIVLYETNILNAFGEYNSEALKLIVRHEAAHLQHHLDILPLWKESFRSTNDWYKSFNQVLTGRDADHGVNWRWIARRFGVTPTSDIRI